MARRRAAYAEEETSETTASKRRKGVKRAESELQSASLLGVREQAASDLASPEASPGEEDAPLEAAL